MRIALVSPCTLGADSNPGWFMITAGIRALVRRVVPDPQFIMVDMMQDNPLHWGAAATCDCAIVCGNPRFTLSDDAWWEGGIWYRLLQLQAAGINVIDGWSGAAFALEEKSFDDMADEIIAKPRNAHFLEYAKAINWRITRDALMTRVYERVGAACVQLPCSSYWAKHDIVGPTGLNTHAQNAIMVISRPHRAGLRDTLHEIHRTMSLDIPTSIVASTWGDYVWARGMGFAPTLISDAASLLQLYHRCQLVLSFRLHAAIPAASMGASVHTIAIDTRATACEPFNIPVTSIDRLHEFGYHFQPGGTDKEAFVVSTLKEMLCP